MQRAHNFYAGPAVLPIQVVEETSKAAMDFTGNGVSIMEISHRSKEFDKVIKEAQQDCLTLMNLDPKDYDVLFLGGGASTQFLMLPYNFHVNKADYVNTGAWSKKAIKESKFFGETNVVASSEETNFNYIPKDFKWNADADYAHITTNNTIYGTEWANDPDTGDVPLVADMSSDMLGKNRDFGKYSLIYAGAQKNLGPSGVTLVIVKKSFLEKAKEDIPTMMKYSTHSEKESLFNTPPSLPIFAVGRTFKWLLEFGGIEKMEAHNVKKAALIYDTIDGNSDFYKGTVTDKVDRSLMNVTWNLPTPELEEKFIAEAKDKDMVGLKGHRSVGGIRASIYNACPIEHVEDLAKFMIDFKKANS